MAIHEETMPVLVSVYCDECFITVTHDYLVPAGQDSLMVARNHLAKNEGWKISMWEDLCKECSTLVEGGQIESDEFEVGRNAVQIKVEGGRLHQYKVNNVEIHVVTNEEEGTAGIAVLRDEKTEELLTNVLMGSVTQTMQTLITKYEAEEPKTRA